MSSQPPDYVSALAEIERLQLELHSALDQLDELRSVGAELAALKSSRSYRLLVRLQTLRSELRGLPNRFGVS
jgi:hypothetical protein